MPPGSPESNNVHDLRTIQAYAISYAYSVTNDFTVALRLPYVRRTGIREAMEDEATGDLEAENFGPADGIGDLTLFGQYRFFNQNHTELAALFGLKTPTGRTNDFTAQGKYSTLSFSPAPALGPIVRTGRTHHEGKWSYDANVLYTRVTAGTQNTDLGDRFQYNFAISYRLSSLGSGEHPMFHGAERHEEGDDGHHHEHGHESTGPSLDLVLELNGEWHAEQVTNGISDPNSGGNTIFISPGLRLSQDKWSFSCQWVFPSWTTSTAFNRSPTCALSRGLRGYLNGPVTEILEITPRATVAARSYIATAPPLVARTRPLWVRC